ncbi:TspO/MBR family protein [Streptomyces sp. NPDC051133]|uniref:TspO/MBR family protein n=1 Tax=Streptomyces sp. NPDC051133 TaxID=3155521 RepID=UPI0034179274
MTPVSGRDGGARPATRRTGPWLRQGAATAAVAATAVAGSQAVDPDSAWYKALRKPRWQPPSWAFGAVWTRLYASIAGAALADTALTPTSCPTSH